MEIKKGGPPTFYRGSTPPSWLSDHASVGRSRGVRSVHVENCLKCRLIA